MLAHGLPLPRRRCAKDAATPEAEKRTVRQMLERYAKDVTPHKGGERHEALRIEKFLGDFAPLADKPLAVFDTPDLGAWRDARLKGYVDADGKKVRAVKPASVVRDINWMRNAFIIARKEWKWIDHHPFDGLRIPQEDAPRDRRVFPKEVRAICRRLDYVTGRAPITRQQEVALAFLGALRTAMRAGEILSLGRANLDLAKRVAEVKHKMQHITGKPRRIPLTRQAVRLLRPVARNKHCFAVSSEVLATLFRRARDREGIIDLHFHDSRGEALTRLARKVDVMTLAKISGHKDINILQNTYYRETAEDIAARL